MPGRKRKSNPVIEDVAKETDESVYDRVEEEYYQFLLQDIDILFVPNENGDDLLHSDDDYNDDYLQEKNYEYYYEKYNNKQSLLNENFIYEWTSGEAKYENPPEDLIF